MPRWVTGMPAAAGTATALVTPGTTRTVDPGGSAGQDLLAASAEHERVAALQPDDDLTAPRPLDHQLLDPVLAGRVVVRELADVDQLGARGEAVEIVGRGQPVVEDDVGIQQRLAGLDGEQPGGARATADQHDSATLARSGRPCWWVCTIFSWRQSSRTRSLSSSRRPGGHDQPGRGRAAAARPAVSCTSGWASRQTPVIGVVGPGGTAGPAHDQPHPGAGRANRRAVEAAAAGSPKITTWRSWTSRSSSMVTLSVHGDSSSHGRTVIIAPGSRSCYRMFRPAARTDGPACEARRNARETTTDP